ncbi:coproporphyrinogen III oxidase [Klebsiella pneumoniae subsp. ozaenae]|uniref:Oxygen-independent coproporphyrinogen III oxidase n=1 Tax=Klebsiella pneumoniae subsp. ozaenae TaxID=574 RepID=A0A378AUX7_KLEPO|nr:coproporphyrinogen III oxidase [Klebsiella pneumoniae subsp. ozaenae]
MRGRLVLPRPISTSIYGLPKQTPESFAFTLQKVAELNPDRLSVFNYAHLPTLFAAQRKIKDADLPSAEQKLEILQETIGSLTTAGYQVYRHGPFRPSR